MTLTNEEKKAVDNILEDLRGFNLIETARILNEVTKIKPINKGENNDREK